MSDLFRPTLTQLIAQARADINGRLPGADSFLRRSVLGVLAVVVAGLVHGLYGYIARLIQDLFIPTAQGAFVDLHASIWGLARKAATPATGTVTVTGSIGDIVPASSQLQRADLVVYQTTAEVTLAGTTASVPVAAMIAGAVGNCLSGTAMTFVSPVTGISSQAVSGVIATGEDQESDDALRARTLARIQNPPQGGSRSDYERWALEVPAVTRAWIYPGWSGPSTVGITFVCDGRSNIIPLSGDVTAVEDHIDPLRPVTADVIVFAPIGDPLDLEIHLTPDSTAIRNAVRAQLADLLARESAPGQTLLLTHIAEAISLAAGEVDHVLVSPTANVTHAAGHIPVLGTIDWT